MCVLDPVLQRSQSGIWQNRAEARWLYCKAGRCFEEGRMGQDEKRLSDKVKEDKGRWRISWAKELQKTIKQEPSRINSRSFQPHILRGSSVRLSKSVATNKARRDWKSYHRTGRQDGVLPCSSRRRSGKIVGYNKGRREGNKGKRAEENYQHWRIPQFEMKEMIDFVLLVNLVECIKIVGMKWKIHFLLNDQSSEFPDFNKGANETGQTKFFLATKTQSVLNITQSVNNECFLFIRHNSQKNQLIKLPHNCFKSDSQSF